MKKNLLITVLLLFCVQAFTQNTLKQIIKGEKGVSKHFVTLDEKTQIAFNPSQARDLFGLNPQSDLVLMNITHDQVGQTHYRYYQTYQNIPVENTMYIVHTANAKVVGMSGVIVTDFSADMPQRVQAKISTQNAIMAAVKHVDAKKYMWQDAAMEQRLKSYSSNKNASYTPVAKLVWYNAGVQVSSPELRLAYKVDVYAKEPLSRADYFIDVQTGEVIGKKDKLQHADATGTGNTQYSGAQTIHSDKGATKYRLRDVSRGNGIITLHGDKATNLDYTSTTANWNLMGQDQHAMDVHWGVEKTYDFYKTKFNRNSLDDNGIALISYVNDGEYDNAHWDGASMNFGILSANNKGVTAIDVTGHELTHGITQYTSGLVYSNESGAMNESMSDIMGKSVQFFAKPADINWRLSNDMGWIIRNMANPKSVYQPDTYQGDYWEYSSSDNGGVHTNSGVGNFMFYLLVNGGSGTNDYGDTYNVTGIGLDKAVQIIYRTEAAYLTPTSQYIDWRDACIQAATDLYGAGSAPVTQVKNAWHAVGVGDHYCSSYGYFSSPYINKIVFNNITNTSGDNSGYHDYTALTANVVRGKTYPIVLYSSDAYTSYWAVFIDFNHDFDFNDANELVTVGNSETTKAYTRYITIPSNALTGKTRMRVEVSDDLSYLNQCGEMLLGETEDYSINVSATLKSGFSEPLAALTENKKGISISPNPVIGGSNAVVNYTTSTQGKITLKVVDIYGRTVQTAEAGLQKAGTHTHTINFARHLAAGSYYVIVAQDNKMIGKTKAMVTQR
jgi:Zn-dependent metalloprotease